VTIAVVTAAIAAAVATAAVAIAATMVAAEIPVAAISAEATTALLPADRSCVRRKGRVFPALFASSDVSVRVSPVVSRFGFQQTVIGSGAMGEFLRFET